jgi:hypothetical protein
MIFLHQIRRSRSSFADGASIKKPRDEVKGSGLRKEAEDLSA